MGHPDSRATTTVVTEIGTDKKNFVFSLISATMVVVVLL
jgi:hypothetical protein